MKKLVLRLGLIVSVFTIALGSCDKPEDTPPPEETTKSLTAKVDGDDFVGELIFGKIDQNHNLIINAVNNQDAEIVLDIKNFDGAGEYDLSALFPGKGTYTPDTSGTDLFSSSSENGNGSVIITNWNDTDSIVDGTFSFKAELNSDTLFVDLTNGEFKNIPVTFIEDMTPDGNNSFLVKVDGVNWEQNGNSVSGQINNDTTLNITAQNTTSTPSSFTINLPNDIAAGTYTIIENNPDLQIIYTESFNTYVSISGSIEITEHNLENNHIEGVFNFVGNNSVTSETKNFTNGEFSVDYEQ